MPRLNSIGWYGMGIAGIQGSINGAFIPDAYGPYWLNDKEVLISQPSDGSLKIVNVTTAARIPVNSNPPNEYRAGGNNWAAWSNAIGLYSPSLFLQEAGLKDVGPDGSIGYVPSYQYGIGCEVYETDGLRWTLSYTDVVYDLQLLGKGMAIWRDQYFKIKTIGMLDCTQIGNVYRPRAVFVNDEWWVCYWSEPVGVVLHPFNSTVGYVIVPPGTDAFNHDAIVIGDLVTVGWSTTSGELPQDYREKSVSVLTDPRQELSPGYVITPINRKMWLGFFAGRPNSGGGWDTNVDPKSLPGNSYLLIPDDILFSGEGVPVGSYITGSSVEEIEQKAENAPYLPFVYWDARYWPRYPNISRDYWFCIQCYCGVTEALDAFEADLRRVLGGLSHLKVALVAQCYTSNSSLTTDLKSLVPIFSRLAADYPNVIATIPFSGSGRKTGLQDHPEVRPLWDEFASTITGEPTMSDVLPQNVYDTLVALRPKYPTPLGDHGAELLNEVAWIHRSEGYGLHNKPGGHNCPQTTTGTRCSCDIIRTKEYWYDVLGDAENAGTPQQGERQTGLDPNLWLAPVQPSGSGSTGNVLILGYDPVCRRSDPNGCLIRFEVESLNPVTEAEFDLENDGEPGIKVMFSQEVARDGRYVRALAFKFTVNGHWTLRVTAKDNLGNVYQSNGQQTIEVTN